MTAFLAGFGIAAVIFFVLFAAVVAFAGIIATVRTAINDALGSFSKIIWILANLLIPGAAFLYFAFVDRNGFLKFVGWVCIIVVVLTGLLGGSALWAGIEGLKRQNWEIQVWPVDPKISPENPVNPDKTPDESNDSSIAL